MKERLICPTLECDAERAWRYGENEMKCRKVWGTLFFEDGSCMSRWFVDTARGFRYTMDWIGSSAA